MQQEGAFALDVDDAIGGGRCRSGILEKNYKIDDEAGENQNTEQAKLRLYGKFSLFHDHTVWAEVGMLANTI
ncbi:hypothetical protein [Solidesulfovibrio sp.]|uniref:hypothetical protein n=1 Tax=Solidesulfovibrio sp. TaxID=2910990 RepID=UPI002B20F4F8|nr:hypothetical protein [Solidesulfovibrio sp.]